MSYATEEFGKNLRATRRAADVTQDALAEVSGVSKDSIVRYEDGATTPGIDNAYALAVALRVTLDDLLPMKPAAGDAA